MQLRFTLLVLAACGSPHPHGLLYVKREPVLHLTPAPPSQITVERGEVAGRPCELSSQLPPLDPVFAPTLSGVTLISAAGDARVAMQDSALLVWSADGSQVALRDRSSLVLWRTSDGAPVERISCPDRTIQGMFAMSPDLRWAVLSGYRNVRGQLSPMMCIMDRSTRAVRVVPGLVQAPRFDGTTLIGIDASVDLVTGTVTPHPRVPYPSPSSPSPLPAPIRPSYLEGADGFEISQDGRHVAGWTEPPVGSPDPSSPPRPSFLAMWDRATGKRLWRDDTRCCGWNFTPDGRFLRKRYDHDPVDPTLVRVDSGKVLEFPGPLSEIAPGGSRVFVDHGGERSPGYLELWSVDPAQPVVERTRARQVLARSRDGAVTIEARLGALAVERAGRCFAITDAFDSQYVIELSPDGREVYFADPRWIQDQPARFTLWRTDTGAATISISVLGPAQFYPMPSVGQVAIAVDHRIHVYDVHTGRLVHTADAPLVRLFRKANGDIRGARDPHGKNADRFIGPVASLVDARGDRLHLVGPGLVDKVPLSIWDLAQPGRVQDLAALPTTGEPERVTAVAVAPDGRYVAAGLERGGVALWARGGRPIRVARHDGGVGQLAFSPDGRALASISYDGLVLVTETTFGTTLGAVELGVDSPTHVWWSPDSARLVIDTVRRAEITVAVPRGAGRP